jgi:DNA-binding NtrC family response regulator
LILHSFPLVFVVIADAELRQRVGWIIGEMNLPHVLVPTWRQGVAEVTERPTLVICDIDGLEDKAMGMGALVSRGWGDPVPLIILSGRPDIEEIAGAFGAVKELSKPINVGALVVAVCGITEKVDQ